MSEDRQLSDLQALDALAAEKGVVLAFRACDGSEELEPVFMRFDGANRGEPSEAALIAITDQRGLSLGRYVVSRARLEAALEGAEDVEEGDPEPTVVPADWGP